MILAQAMPTLLSFLTFTGLVGLVTWRLTRRDDHRSGTGYFLAGRSLTFPLIAGSLLLTNLSTEQMIGLNGAAFRDGLSVIAWEVVAVLALVAMALFFLRASSAAASPLCRSSSNCGSIAGHTRSPISFGYLQKMNGIYFIPIFAVVTVGMLSRRVPALAAKVALVAGCSLIAIGYFVPPFDRWVAALHEFHFLGAVFVLLVAAMLAIGALRPRPEPWRQTDAGAVNLTPWRHARLTGLALVGIVLLLYVVFADFGALRAAAR